MAVGDIEMDVSGHGDREEDIPEDDLDTSRKLEDDIDTGPIFQDEQEVDVDEYGNMYGPSSGSIDERLAQARVRFVKSDQTSKFILDSYTSTN